MLSVVDACGHIDNTATTSHLYLVVAVVVAHEYQVGGGWALLVVVLL